MRILVVTACTGQKTIGHEAALTIDDFLQSEKHIKSREKALSKHLTPAENLYRGQQHIRLMRGIKAFRKSQSRNSFNNDLDLWILSAGYGLVPADRKLAPYGCTFQGMKSQDILKLAVARFIPIEVRQLLSQPFDLGLILLGSGYLKACDLDENLYLGGPTLLFCGKSAEKRLPKIKWLKPVVLTNAEAKRFSCGLVGLKGELAARLLEKLASNRNFMQALTEPAVDVLAQLDGNRSRPGKPLSISTTRANAKVDRVITIPRSWWDKPHRKELRYFIPEWDDLVDPNYDFINDQHSGGRGDWSNEVYAHQMYSEPNYDGILMSRAVAEKSKKKKERINNLGVHRYLRVPPDFPIMGDCGAFDYIMEEMPPYTTGDVIDYYTRLGFDYGVSVDHLIVKATESQKKIRYELTIHNAEEFLKAHRKAGLKWEPIGAVQGWDPKSYAKAAYKYAKMGYRYIALGGLVRSSTNVILAILEEVHRNIPEGVHVHLFGLARLNAILGFKRYGVTSVDSASALRRAWLGGKDNYWSQSGNHYRAIRIPEAGKSFRAKRMVSEGRADADFVNKIEKQCISAVRQYDQGNLKINEVLDIIDEYDHLITPDRDGMREQYRRTLEDKPWEKCQCDICKKDGVEVVIFRGNNRNRRRGFHNTYVFYKLLQQVLETGDTSLLYPNLKPTTDSKQRQLFPS